MGIGAVIFMWIRRFEFQTLASDRWGIRKLLRDYYI